MKELFVEDLMGQEGKRVTDEIFLLDDREVRSASNGSRYLKMKLRDRSGIIDAVKWDIDERTANSLRRNDYVMISGLTRRYNDQSQINVQLVERYNGKLDPCDFAPSSPRDLTVMRRELAALVKMVESPYLAGVLRYYFDDPDFLDCFCQTTGAVKIHHAYVGGLLEHTLSTAQLCLAVVKHYPEIGINRDLLVTGALLHDIGKVREYGPPPSFERTTEGLFEGHIALGALMIDEAIRTIPDYPELVRASLIHLILSHHGTRDFGSPVEPASLEAFILHFMDDLDAKMANIWGWITQKHHQEATDRLWTDKCFPLDRLIFKGIPEELLNGNGGGKNGGNGSQGKGNNGSADPFFDF